MIINIISNEDLRVLLGNLSSGPVLVSADREPNITQVRIFNPTLRQVLKGTYNVLRSYRDSGNALVIFIKNARIENFYPTGSWEQQFGDDARMVYSEEISIQRKGSLRVGIVRSGDVATMNPVVISDYFRRLRKEISLRGLQRIVFTGGGSIPIPAEFLNWCKENGVEIEILSAEEIQQKYPVEKDIFWEDEIFFGNDLMHQK